MRKSKSRQQFHLRLSPCTPGSPSRTARRVCSQPNRRRGRFNKLLLSFLEDLDPTVRALVEGQFRGEFRYRTTCEACKNDSASSRNRIPFCSTSGTRAYVDAEGQESCAPPAESARTPTVADELELNVKGCASVEQSLRQYTESETLEGVECETCNAKHDANRAIELVSLPPVLCLQLLRFVYDIETNSKKKGGKCFQPNKLARVNVTVDQTCLRVPVRASWIEYRVP